MKCCLLVKVKKKRQLIKGITTGVKKKKEIGKSIHVSVEPKSHKCNKVGIQQVSKCS